MCSRPHSWLEVAAGLSDFRMLTILPYSPVLCFYFCKPTSLISFDHIILLEDYFSSTAGVNRLFFLLLEFKWAFYADPSGIHRSIYTFHFYLSQTS